MQGRAEQAGGGPAADEERSGPGRHEPVGAGDGDPGPGGCCGLGDDSRPREPAPLSLRLTELGRAAGAGLRRHLAPLGLDARHYRVLAEVAHLDGCSQRALTARLGIPPSRVVVILDGLEQRRLVERRERPGDRRSYALGLTPAGRDLLERARPLVEACDLALAGGLAEADRRDLDRLLQELAANCRSTAGSC